jgi:hypothetical protein
LLIVRRQCRGRSQFSPPNTQPKTVTTISWNEFDVGVEDLPDWVAVNLTAINPEKICWRW